MKNYNVTLTGQQKHIKGSVFENQTESKVNQIIDKHLDEGFDRPLFNGDSFELNGDLYIRIEEAK